MSRSIYECLHDLNESGFSLSQLVQEIELQLSKTRNNPSTANRYLSIARTHIEAGLLYLMQYERETDSRVPIMSEDVEEVWAELNKGEDGSTHEQG